MGKITRALISVSDKTGIVELGEALASKGVEILSTGGTAKALRDAGLKVKDVSEHTGFPEMMDGRLKTLHPLVHGGLLGRRGKDDEEMKAQNILPIDMVVVNLYPFEATVAKPDVHYQDAIENIDIGGPTMLRSAAKNHKDVTVVVDPDDYPQIMVEMRENDGAVSEATNRLLARKVFELTSRYDSLIAKYLFEQTKAEDETFQEILVNAYKLKAELRYGENPHQDAAAYDGVTGGLNLLDAQKLQGKEMSFNNYCDTHSALVLAREFDKPACVIVKHNNPCGVGIGENTVQAFGKAFNTDPASAFGGVLAFNQAIDNDTAIAICKNFVEIVLAPDYHESALKVFESKPDIRVLKLPGMMDMPIKGKDIKSIAGGVLIQDWDTKNVDIKSLKAVTKREPTDDEIEAMAFAWKVVKHVKSNSIVYAHKDRTVGIGMGQTSRVFAAKVGAINASEPLTATVVASDGFFPFRDGIDSVKKMGVTAVIQPGGSVKDKEVIAAADELDVAMLLTGTRHFKH
jgi:phosphoribosylaminoimidazolecarboxamide formyltransferase/IMP cyclohydrolase